MIFWRSSILIFLALTTCFFSNPTELREKARKGVSHQKQGRCAHAIKLFKEVVNAKPHWYSLYNRIADCFQKLDYDEIAMNYYRKTLKYDPVNSLATKQLQKYLKSKKSLQTAETVVMPKVSKDRFFSSNEIKQMQERLWFLRDGILMTSLRDGRDLREYSPLVYFEVFPERGSDRGFPVLMQEKLNAPKIVFFLYPNDGALIRITSDEYDCSLPLFIPETNELLFVARKVIVSPGEDEKVYTYEDRYSIYGLDLREDSYKARPRGYHKSFHSILDLKKGEANTTYIVAQKEIDQVSRVFQWVRGEKISQISFGFGADYSIQKSPDGENLVRMVKGADDKFGYFVTNIKSKQSFALTSIKSKKMTGVWSPDSKNFIFASSEPGIEDRWQTTVYKVSIPQLLVSELFQSNFLYKDFLIDESGEMIYFLSNYDNNYEVYRYDMETKSQERLTISTGDETRLGFWTFSGI